MALGISSALTVCLMSLSFVLCTLMLVGILKAFDINSNRRQTFREFWILRCEDDWRKAFKVKGEFAFIELNRWMKELLCFVVLLLWCAFFHDQSKLCGMG